MEGISLKKPLFLKLILIWIAILSTIFLSPKSATTIEKPDQKKTQPSAVFDIVKVTKVIDGDTIEIEDGKRVRYIGIDTPEKENCYFYESTKRNKELVEGKVIKLEKDISQTDKYGRFLRYVYIDDLLINEALVKEGFAQVATFPPDIKYKNRFLEAQKIARENKVGFWLNCQKKFRRFN